MKDTDEVTYHIYLNENKTAYTLDVAATGSMNYQEFAACLIDFANSIKEDEKAIFGELEEIQFRDN